MADFDYVYVAAWLHEWAAGTRTFKEPNRIWSGGERGASAIGASESVVFDNYFDMTRWDEGTSIKATERVIYGPYEEKALLVTIASIYGTDQYYIIRRQKFIHEAILTLVNL